jgi:hypothetical protein
MLRIASWHALLVAGFVLVRAAPALAQQPTPHLYSGGWSTLNAEGYTTITATGNLTPHVYRITAPQGPETDALQFAIYVDGQPLPVPLFQGGSAVVQGSRIAMLQRAGGASVPGSWTVLQEPQVPVEQINWIGYPSIDREILVASLKTEQEFVLTLTRGGGTQCKQTTMTVTIDGTPVRATNGQPMVFHDGASVLGKGKVVTVRVGGTCPPPPGIAWVAGTLRIRQFPAGP